MTSVYFGLLAFGYVACIFLVLRLMHNCPVDDEEEFSMGQGPASPVASSDRATCSTLNRSGRV